MKKVGLFLKKHWVKIISLIIIAILVVYVPIVALKKAGDYEIYKEPEIDTKIYTIWHIETFEGGGKSRLQLLNSVAREIESQAPGVLIMVKKVEASKLVDELKNSKPDIFSFGYGVGKTILPVLTPFNTSYDLLDKMVESGTFNGNIYALPYMVSGYAMFSHGGEFNNFYCGQNEFINPSAIYNGLSLTPYCTESQYNAYKHFIYDKKSKLLGSARDVFRVSNLNNVGRLSASITPVSEYTDLLQYLALTKSDDITKKFADLIFSDARQQELSSYNLFTGKNYKIYSSGIYSDMENALHEATIPNAFI